MDPVLLGLAFVLITVIVALAYSSGYDIGKSDGHTQSDKYHTSNTDYLKGLRDGKSQGYADGLEDGKQGIDRTPESLERVGTFAEEISKEAESERNNTFWINPLARENVVSLKVTGDGGIPEPYPQDVVKKFEDRELIAAQVAQQKQLDAQWSKHIETLPPSMGDEFGKEVSELAEKQTKELVEGYKKKRAKKKKNVGLEKPKKAR